MDWATFKVLADPNTERTGVISGERVFALPKNNRLVGLIAKGQESLLEIGEAALRTPVAVYDLEEILLRPPIPNPASIRDFAAFHEHISVSMRNLGRPLDENWFDAPTFYFTSPNNLFAHGEVVRAPGDTVQMDYELEICAVIGVGGIDIDPGEAHRHIAGYSILNDWSARDLQEAEMRRLPIGPGKGKDSATSIGPYLVTPEGLQDRTSGTGFDLRMTAKVNGREYSSGNWSSLYWSFEEMIAFASRNSPLVPGDIIGAGTVGTGCILEQSGTFGADRYPWLQEGDEVVLEVERIGSLRNTLRWNKAPIPLRG